MNISLCYSVFLLWNIAQAKFYLVETSGNPLRIRKILSNINLGSKGREGKVEEGGDYSDREYGEDYSLGGPLGTGGALGPIGPDLVQEAIGQTANVSCLNKFQKFLKLIL